MPHVQTKNRLQPAGTTYLELQVAFVLFGVAVSGLGPLVVMQSRQMAQLESRFADQTPYYLTPSDDPWARKLGAAATSSTQAPSPPADPVTLIDDQDPGFSQNGSGWGYETLGTAFQSDAYINHENGGSDTAFWEFNSLQPRQYEVFVTHPWTDDFSKNAPYTVYDGALELATVDVDQHKAPSGPLYLGVPWTSLGEFQITGNTLRVMLTNSPGKDVAADAVRIEPRGNSVQIQSLQKSINDDTVTVIVSVTSS